MKKRAGANQTIRRKTNYTQLYTIHGNISFILHILTSSFFYISWVDWV